LQKSRLVTRERGEFTIEPVDQANDDIPIRANKKKGLKSKKEVREEIQTQAASQLKEIAVKHGYVSGKW
jgi:hypothetical protein